VGCEQQGLYSLQALSRLAVLQTPGLSAGLRCSRRQGSRLVCGAPDARALGWSAVLQTPGLCSSNGIPFLAWCSTAAWHASTITGVSDLASDHYSFPSKETLIGADGSLLHCLHRHACPFTLAGFGSHSSTFSLSQRRQFPGGHGGSPSGQPPCHRYDKPHNS
jgi:hypothetical protein